MLAMTPGSWPGHQAWWGYSLPASPPPLCLPLIKLWWAGTSISLPINEDVKSQYRPGKWARTKSVLGHYINILTHILLLLSHRIKLIILEFLSPAPTEVVTVPSLRSSLTCAGVKIHTQEVPSFLRKPVRVVGVVWIKLQEATRWRDHLSLG